MLPSILQYPHARQRLYRARQMVVQTNFFFARTAYIAKIIEDNNQPTACTDGIDIYYNSDFIERLYSMNDVAGVFLHELLHIQLCHVPRIGDRNIELWNVAADIRINTIIAKDTVFTLPSGGIDPYMFPTYYQQLTVEQIYAELLKSAIGSGVKGHDTLKKPSPKKAKEVEEAKRNMDRAISRGLADAKKAGQHIEQIYKAFGFNQDGLPKVDWKDEVRHMILDERRDISGDWMRPNRRFISSGLYLPGPMETASSKLVICFDTSGSMWSKQIQEEMVNEACALLEEEIVTNVIVICTDTKVREVIDVTSPPDILDLEMKGGGGTNFQHCMEYIRKMQNDICGVLFFTDMESESFGDDPGVPVIFVDWRKYPNEWYKLPDYGRIINIGPETSRG